MRLWDLRTEKCNAKIECATTPCVAYDLQGLIFAAAGDDGEVKLYDARGHDKGPFNSRRVGGGGGGAATCLKFSADGESAAGGARGGTMYIHDAFDFSEKMRINVAMETSGFLGAGRRRRGSAGQT